MIRLIILTIILFSFSCSGDNNVQFCEGVDLEGKGVNCGAKFAAGELTALVDNKKPFETEKIDVVVTQLNKDEVINRDKYSFNVKQGESVTSFNLPMHNIGHFKVEASQDGTVISTGEITITE